MSILKNWSGSATDGNLDTYSSLKALVWQLKVEISDSFYVLINWVLNFSTFTFWSHPRKTIQNTISGGTFAYL
jgi:hypothetical protein